MSFRSITSRHCDMIVSNDSLYVKYIKYDIVLLKCYFYIFLDEFFQNASFSISWRFQFSGEIHSTKVENLIKFEYN